MYSIPHGLLKQMNCLTMAAANEKNLLSVLDRIKCVVGLDIIFESELFSLSERYTYICFR